MINKQLLKISISNMAERKLRSSLTIISVLIGVTAIFVLISFGQGLVGFVDEFSTKMGDDKIIVQAKGVGFGPPPSDSNVQFSEDDVEFIEDIQGVKEATGVYYKTAPIEFEEKRKQVYIIGSDIKDHKKLIEEIYSIELYSGIELKGKEKKDAILGYGYTKDDGTFPTSLKLRDKILINEQKIQIKGFYEEIGNPIDDYNVYLTREGYEELFNPKSFQSIFIRSSPGEVPSKVAKTIQNELIDYRDQTRGNEDFFVETFEQVIKSFTSILTTINIVLILIALISLVVAGVNIANTMYASVLERTKDIGVMKAIGAKNNTILFTFAFEAAILSLIGGILAVIIGTIITIFAGNIVAAAGYGVLAPALKTKLYISCILFSIFIGIASGILPAYRASKMNPVDALRYE
jgi:putative ABC transport system permease protein